MPPVITTVPPAAIAKLCKAMGLTDEQAAVTRGLLTDQTLWGIKKIADVFGVQDQAVRRWKDNRRKAIEAGQKPGPTAFIAPYPAETRSQPYVAGEVYLWGMQTDRLRHDGTINTERHPVGKGAVAERPAPPDYNAQRAEVVQAYRKQRRAGLDDKQAREALVKILGISRRIVARRLYEAEKFHADEFGSLWDDRKQLQKAS